MKSIKIFNKEVKYFEFDESYQLELTDDTYLTIMQTCKNPEHWGYELSFHDHYGVHNIDDAKNLAEEELKRLYKALGELINETK